MEAVRPLHIMVAANLLIQATILDMEKRAAVSPNDLIHQCHLAGETCIWAPLRTQRGLCHQLQPTIKQSRVFKQGFHY